MAKRKREIDRLVRVGHGPVTYSGHGRHDSRPRRQRTRASARRAALREEAS